MEPVAAMKPNPGNGASRDRRLAEGVIGSLPLFRQTSPRHVSEITSYARTSTVRRGAVITERGAAIPGVIAVAYGMVKLAIERANGDERVVRFVNAGETFGESSALFGRPSIVRAVAMTDSMVVVIPPGPLLRLLELDPGFTRRMVENLAERAYALMEELEAGARLRGPQRLASYLHGLVEPDETTGSWHVRLPAPKSLIAARLGFTKETMSRLLRKFAEQGLIQLASRKISILDRERLARVAQSGD